MVVAVGGCLLGRTQCAPTGLRKKPFVSTGGVLLIHRAERGPPSPLGKAFFVCSHKLVGGALRAPAVTLNVGRGLAPADLWEK